MSTFNEYLKKTSGKEVIGESSEDLEDKLKDELIDLLDGRNFTDPDDDRITYMIRDDAENLANDILRLLNKYKIDYKNS